MQRSLYRLLRNGLFTGLLCLCACAASQARAGTVLVLGDSISAAYGMSLQQGWVALLERKLRDSHPQIRVVNASISGETSAGGLRRLPQLLQQYRPQLVIIELGANDGLRGYPVRTLRRNLQQLIDLATAADARVILLPMEIPPNYGGRYTTDFRQSYTQVAQATGAALAPFVLEGVATESALMQDDGLHPTAAAQPVLLDNVLPTVLSVLDEL
ncbi:MAG: arylesterase [Halioglobus sp.]|nr:arylesterase [Halioglobus sp.]